MTASEMHVYGNHQSLGNLGKEIGVRLRCLSDVRGNKTQHRAQNTPTFEQIQKSASPPMQRPFPGVHYTDSRKLVFQEGWEWVGLLGGLAGRMSREKNGDCGR